MEPLGIRYIRPIRPVDFPASDPEWDMVESDRHQQMCEVIRDVLRRAATSASTVGSDHFIYFDASNSQRKCAPDAFVVLGVPQESITSWKTWEKGAPHLCVEILSPSDTQEKLPLQEKLARFHTMGVDEVIAFDTDAEPGKRLRAWDLHSGDLVERVVEGDITPCRALGLWFVSAPYELLGLPYALRLAETAAGTPLVPTPLEAERAEKERAIAERDSLVAENARLRAELANRR